MTAGVRGGRVWVLLALALLGIGLLAAVPSEPARLALRVFAQSLFEPISGTIVLIGAGMAFLLQERRLAARFCALAAALLLGMQTLPVIREETIFFADHVFAGTFPTVISFFLIASLMLRRSWASAACLVSMGGCIAYLLVAAAPSVEVPSSFERLLQIFLFFVLSVARLRVFARRDPIWRREAQIRHAGPIVIAALFIGVVVWQLTASNQDLSGVHRAMWIVVAGSISFWFTVSLFTTIVAESSVLKLSESGAYLKRLLRRRRELIHRRAGQLRQARMRYEELFRDVPAPVVLTRPNGEILSANPAMLDLLGVDSEEKLRSQNFSSFYADPALRTILVEQWRHADTDVHQGEIEIRRADGEHRNVLYTLRTLRNPDRTIDAIQGTLADITDLRRAEAKRHQLESSLRLSQKLESVGRLAAGIAHEINTPMQYIGDNVYFLRQSFESLQELFVERKKLLDRSPEEPASRLITELLALDERLEVEETLSLVPGAFDRAQHGIEAVSHIVAAMKELAHPGQGSKVSTNVNALIDTALTVTRNAYKTIARVETDLSDIPNLLTYKNELCQVLINLIVNAAHAIESAKEVAPQDGVIRIRTSFDGENVHIEVEDNGCGIPDAVKEKIFDPFFTTKSVGRGTGQGLAIARAAVVDKHEGEIRLDSVVGKGSTFKIRLPIQISGAHADSESEEIG